MKQTINQVTCKQIFFCINACIQQRIYKSNSNFIHDVNMYIWTVSLQFFIKYRQTFATENMITYKCKQNQKLF